MPKLVVGMDGSPGGHRALAWALQHAADTGATVEAVTAFSLEGTDWLDPDGPGDAWQYHDARQARDVQAALDEFRAPPTVHRTVIQADPVQSLLRAASDADLLILGSHGRGRAATALLGSVSERCIRHSPVPVLVIPAGKEVARTMASVLPAARQPDGKNA